MMIDDSFLFLSGGQVVTSCPALGKVHLVTWMEADCELASMVSTGWFGL